MLIAKKPYSEAISHPPAEANASPPLTEVSIVIVFPSTLKALVLLLPSLLESSFPVYSLSSFVLRSELSPESVTPQELNGIPNTTIKANGVAFRRNSTRELVLPRIRLLEVATMEYFEYLGN